MSPGVAASSTGRLLLLGLAISGAMLLLGGWVLFQSRQDAWTQAYEASDNLLLTLQRDIRRDVGVFALSLQDTIDTLAQPGFAQAPAAVRRHALVNRAMTAENLGSLLVLDARGDVVVDDSTSFNARTPNLADYDFFKVHRGAVDTGLYLSRAFRSPLHDGDPSIALSRRLTAPDGSFGGVVMSMMRLSSFQNLFEQLEVGMQGSITLCRTDGHLVARYPYHSEDFDRDVGTGEIFQKFSAARSGRFVSTSTFDGVRRLYTFRHVGDLPLVLSVNLSEDDILAPWRRRALTMGGMLVALCLATATLSLLFRRELLRRASAERALTDAAGQLAALAMTDSLTGVSNRRRFDAELAQVWTRAERQRGPVSLLLIDVDRFKAYNDRYGHQDGDACLRAVAETVQGLVDRPGDLFARLGGEEFVALLPGTSAAEAEGLAGRICAAVFDRALPHAGNLTCGGVVTVSIGCATALPHPGGTAAIALVASADALLYEAKRTGRNRVVGTVHAVLASARAAVA